MPCKEVIFFLQINSNAKIAVTLAGIEGTNTTIIADMISNTGSMSNQFAPFVTRNAKFKDEIKK